jgi:hypothetical protein
MTKAQERAKQISGEWYQVHGELIPPEAIEKLIKSIAEQTRLHVQAQFERYDPHFCKARHNILADARWEDKQA